MGRPRTFDRDEALQQVLELFWSRGYDAVSMSDLQRMLGIGRQSLYNTFGDKDQAFVEALESYVHRSNETVARELPADGDLDTLRAHLNRVVEGLSAEPRRGCLIMNTTTGRSPHDARTAEVTGRALANLRAGYVRVLDNARRRDQIPADANVEGLAALLTSQSAGLSVLSRGGASRQELQQVVDAVLAAITG